MKVRIVVWGGLLLLIPLFVIVVRNPILFVGKSPLEGNQQANKEILRQHVEKLAASDPPRNFAYPESLKKTAEYIVQKFEESGLKAEMPSFKIRKNTYYNVVTELGPKEGEAIVIGAHYDVCDDLPGADDNASGTAGLLELARMLAPIQDKLTRPVILVAYTLEEPPNFRAPTMGSVFHAKSMKEAGRTIKLMLSIEMIGYFKDEPDSQKYPLPAFKLLYPTVGNFISIIGRPNEFWIMRQAKAIFMSATDIPTYTANVPAAVPGVDYSDHLSYWNLGYPAVMVTDTAFMRNENYHKATDLPDTLDYERMAEVVNGIFAIATKL